MRKVLTAGLYPERRGLVCTSKSSGLLWVATLLKPERPEHLESLGTGALPLLITELLLSLCRVSTRSVLEFSELGTDWAREVDHRTSP